jgi:type III pantothenate kinase
MNLCIDEGNTAVKYAFFENQKMLYSGIDIESIDAPIIHNAIISTVLENSAAVAWCQKNKVPFHLLSAKSKLPFSISYQTPETLGNDRLAAIAGAMIHFPNQNTLVIIAGSCITFNFIDNQNCFLGGAISPGIQMRLKAMNQFTAKLPLIKWNAEMPNDIIGADTPSSMVNGVAFGVLNEMEGVIKTYKDRFTNLNIILSGGDAPFLVSQLKNNIFARPELLLEGLNYILNHNDV